MSEQTRMRLSWLFVALVGAAGAILFLGNVPVLASDDHEEARAHLERGAVMPLAQLLQRPGIVGMNVLEAELEHEHGRLVYELELLDADGRVQKRYFDAASGEPLAGKRDR